MKKNLSVTIVACILFQLQTVSAQCNLHPAINPSELIFCADATDTLSTQKFDSYQWLRNNVPINGETNRKIILHQREDQGYNYSVAVTKDGCKDTSKNVFADGYAFNPPILIETGDIGVLNPNLDALIECPGDTLILTLGSTYSINIQWYNLQKPIEGANASTYYVTRNGSYTVCGAPSVCPNYIQCESLPLNTVFENPKVNVTKAEDSLVASPKKKIYQWYVNGNKIAGANESYYLPSQKGIYNVVAYDRYTCKAVSRPVIYKPQYNNITITAAPNPAKDVLHVHINSTTAKEIQLSDLNGNLILHQPVLAPDENVFLRNIHAGTYVLHVLTNDNSISNSLIIIKE